MIKKNYKDVHFINKGTQVIDKVYKGTDLVFEQGYTREQTGVPPITTTYQAIGKNLKDYKIYGNSVQDGTPTPNVPIEIESVGDLITDTNDINYGKYKIPVKVKDTNNIVQSTINIYLDEPLRKVGDYADYIDFKNQKEFRNVIVNDDTGTQTIENSYTGTTDSSGTSISLPNIPTIKGTTIFEIDTNINASNMYIKYKSK